MNCRVSVIAVVLQNAARFFFVGEPFHAAHRKYSGSEVDGCLSSACDFRRDDDLTEAVAARDLGRQVNSLPRDPPDGQALNVHKPTT